MRNRLHDARNPVQLGTMTAMVPLGVVQLLAGAQGSRALITLSPWMLRAFAVLIILSAVACLVSTRLPGVAGAHVERGGLSGLACALLVYCVTLIDSVPGLPTSLGLALGGMGIGCAVRARQVKRETQEYRRTR